jgi:uncharacterized protein YndB with AHSA1/START domain
LLKEWFCPKPWYVSECQIDLRPGGVFATVMRGPAGEEHSDPGIWLEVVPLERLAFTSVMSEGWQPKVLAPGSFALSIVVTFREAAGGGTAYSARALHADANGRDTHSAMGFEAGWGAAAAQLDELAMAL